MVTGGGMKKIQGEKETHRIGERGDNISTNTTNSDSSLADSEGEKREQRK